MTGDIRISGRTKDGAATVTITGAPALVNGVNTYVADIPATCYWILPEVRVSGLVGKATIVANSLMLRKQVNAVTIEDGAVKAAKLEATLALISEIIAGNPAGTHAKMTPTSFKVLAANAAGGLPTEVMRMGTDADDYFGVLNAQNELVASISSTGAMSATSMDVEGYDLVTNTGGIILGGTQLSDTLDGLGGNIIAWASRYTDGKFYAGTSAHPYLHLQASLKAGRMYTVSTSPIHMKSDTANSDTMVKLHQGPAGRAATIADPVIDQAYSLPASWNTSVRSPITFNRLLTTTTSGD
ncbi:hypothetical protein [Arthrobacter sp. NPDC058192]|uniref:hypothetical protein n=1 Tax=Arthrobacter sp. NPDC058192 TaxID=3346372 RepID=UPI0036EE468D